MADFDADIGWIDSQAMVLCECFHYYRSHRPMSRKCSLCGCEQFTAQISLKRPAHPPDRSASGR